MVPTKWVYKEKKHERGIPIRCRARLVALGYKKLEGIDYKEVYARVGKYASARLLMPEAVQHDYDMGQLDVSAAFMHNPLEEPVFVKPLPRYEQTWEAWKLRKALNGLKRSGRAWFKHLQRILMELGLTVAHADESLYIFRDDSNGKATYILENIGLDSGSPEEAFTNCG